LDSITSLHVIISKMPHLLHVRCDVGSVTASTVLNVCVEVANLCIKLFDLLLCIVLGIVDQVISI